MANNNIDDWEDIPVNAETDDWEDVPVEQPSLISKLGDKLASSGESALDTIKEYGIPALETAQDFSIGAAKGATLGSLDELGGLLGAGVETGLGALGIGPAATDAELQAQGFDVKPQTFLQKYRDYQQASEQEQKAAEDRSPVVNTLGQIAGGMTSGHIASGLLGAGKAAKGVTSISDIAKNQGMSKAAIELLKRSPKEYAKMAPLLGLEIGLSSEEQLLGENANPTALAADVAGGLAFGLPVMLGLQGASEIVAPTAGKKAGEYTQKIKDAFQSEDNPRLRQMAKSYTEYGQNLKTPPRSHAADISEAGSAFSKRDQRNVRTIMETLGKADAELGRNVGQSLKTAADNGVLVDVSPSMQAAAQRLQEISQTIPNLANSRKSVQAYEKMLGGETQLNPLELKTLIDDIDASIGVFKAATNKTPADASTLAELIKFRKDISTSLKQNVKDYAQAAERFENFRRVLEQIVSGGKPLDVTDKFYGKLRDADNKIYSSLESMIQNVQRDDEAAKSYRTAFVNTMDALKDFETKEASRVAADPRLKQVLPSTNQLRKFILDASDDSVLRGSVKRTTAERGLMPDLKELIIGKAPTSGAYYAGRISQSDTAKNLANMSKKIYNAPTEALTNLASKLEASKFKSLGEALRTSIESGNTGKRNAILFTIMQNPDARLLIDAEDVKE